MTERNTKRRWILGIAGLVGTVLMAAQAAQATPEAWSSVTDRLLWATEDRYVVLRITELGYASYYQRQTHYERVDLSVWDGRVLARCSLGLQEARDTTADGDWEVSLTPPDPGCDALPSEGMAHPTPLLQPGVRIALVGGAVEMMSDDGTSSTLADRDFVSSRLFAMMAAERAACEDQPQTWPMFGGCFLAEETAHCTVDPTVWANAETVFLHVLCDDPEQAFTDLDASRSWLAVGRHFWNAQAE